MSRVILGDLTLYSFDASKEEHLDYKNELVRDKSVVKFLKTLKKELQKTAKQSGHFSFNTPYFASLNGEFVGYVYVFNPEEEDVELKYAVDRCNRGNRYGEKILRETSAYLLHSFEEIKRVKLIIVENNIHSINAALKAGFIKESTFEYYKEGKKK